MKTNCKKPRLLVLIITAVGILLDQATKLLVSRLMELNQTIPLIEGVLHITHVQNRGAAFGMLAENRWVFLVISSVTIVALGIFLAVTSMRNKWILASLSMILSGGIGNMIDRLALGYVVDFIDFRLINFAVFNGADSFVCVGAALLFLAVLLEPKETAALRETPTEEASPEAEDDGHDS